MISTAASIASWILLAIVVVLLWISRPWRRVTLAYAVRLTDEAMRATVGPYHREGLQLWLEDDHEGGNYDDEFGRAIWYDSPGEALVALAGLDDHEDVVGDHVLIRLDVDPRGGNHYLMTEVPWPTG